MLDAIATIVTEEQPQWKGTASELLILLPQLEIAPNILTRKLNISVERLLREHGIRYETSRGHDGRMITLTLQPKARGIGADYEKSRKYIHRYSRHC